MNLFSNLIARLPILLISLPIVLLSLSVHELSHGYIALRLGDPTARNMGRLTLNPIKHIDVIGFICMLLFHFGWANPVPINTRHFKNPRRDMALTGAAGPVSNLLLAVVFAVLLRLSLLLATGLFDTDLGTIFRAAVTQSAIAVSQGFTVLAIVVYMLYLGIIINLSYALFNLLPIPPLDGSRIFYVFLPVKWYFAVMKYERIIALVMLIGLWTGYLAIPLEWAVNGLEQGLCWITGIRGEAGNALTLISYYIGSML